MEKRGMRKEKRIGATRWMMNGWMDGQNCF